MVVARELEEQRMRNCLIGTECQFCKMKQVLETGYTTMWMYLTLLCSSPKTAKVSNLCDTYFTAIKIFFKERSNSGSRRGTRKTKAFVDSIFTCLSESGGRTMCCKRTWRWVSLKLSPCKAGAQFCSTAQHCTQCQSEFSLLFFKVLPGSLKSSLHKTPEHVPEELTASTQMWMPKCYTLNEKNTDSFCFHSVSDLQSETHHQKTVDAISSWHPRPWSLQKTFFSSFPPYCSPQN